MLLTRRKKDPVWDFFIQTKSSYIKGTRAKCIKCGFEMAGLVDRMKTHLNKCRLRDVRDSAVTSNDMQIDGDLRCYNYHGK